jgi:hypothetical protein
VNPDGGNGWRDWALLGFVLVVGIALYVVLT